MAELGVAGAVGALIGAYLLTRTSSSAFRAVVPWLILFACLLLAVQPLVSHWLAAARQGPATIGPLLVAGDAAGGVLDDVEHRSDAGRIFAACWT